MAEFNDVESKLRESKAFLERLSKLLDVAKREKDIAAREAEAGQASFWSDSSAAKKKSKELNDLKKVLGVWQKAQKTLDDLAAHFELAQEAKDQGELREVEKSLKEEQRLLSELDASLKL